MRLMVYLSAALLGICSVSLAQITGKVMFQGDPPDMPQIKAVAAVPQCAAMHKDPVYEDTVLVGDKGEFQNVIVFVKPAAGGVLKGPKIDKPAVLDQKGCMYRPHVLAVEVGQPVIVKNSDSVFHNVHSLAIKNPAFNFAEINVSERKIDPFTTAETFQIKCDVHPWMKAIVRVFDNPYFAVTDEGGNYSIDCKGLPDGTYTVQAWQEVYQDSEPQQVQVTGGKSNKPVNFVFKAKAGKAEAKPMNEIHLASAGAAAACCSDASRANTN